MIHFNTKENLNMIYNEMKGQVKDNNNNNLNTKGVYEIITMTFMELSNYSLRI
jgi:hypothetical protein